MTLIRTNIQIYSYKKKRYEYDTDEYSNWKLYKYLNIWIFVSFLIRIFIRIIFVSFLFIRIYSDIRSYRFLDTNIFGYSFVSKSIRMSHSGSNTQGWWCWWWKSFIQMRQSRASGRGGYSVTSMSTYETNLRKTLGDFLENWKLSIPRQ